MKVIKKIFDLLDKTQKKRFLWLQLLVLLTALFEAISVIAIAPLMSSMGNEIQSNSSAISSKLPKLLFSSGEAINLKTLGILFLLILFVANTLSILTIWKLSRFAAEFGASISNKLYIKFLGLNYTQFIKTGSSHFGKQITSEVSRLTDNVLQPMVQINARLISGLMICVLLFIYNPLATCGAIVIFASAYAMIYFFVHKSLYRNGKLLSYINQKRFGYINEAINAFREVRSFGADIAFINRFKESSAKFSHAYSTLNTIYNTPRFIIEFFVFSTLVVFVAFFSGSTSSAEILSTFSVFGLSALKLLPTFQQIYGSLAQIKGHKNALDTIHTDLFPYDELFETKLKLHSNSFKHYAVASESALSIIEVKDLVFSYEPEKKVLDGVSLLFLKGTLNAIVGRSGAGKSTLADILTGLLHPTSGEIWYSGQVIEKDNDDRLRSSVALVPQNVTIIQGTVSENVCFLTEDNIDIEKVRLSLEAVGLLDFFMSCKDQLNTMLGDGYMLLSGGQKQRLAIARALYTEREILLLDEPTSALDPMSEQVIVSLVQSLVPTKTVITITHKLSTIERYDQIIVLDKGSIAETGRYSQLLADSSVFKSIMSTHLKS